MRYSSGNLFGYAWLTFTLTRLKVHAEGGVACKDQHGRSYESGFHYIPGPEPCTFCICDNGNPKLCKAFICKFLEEDCKSFRRGDACCEFICLDDTLPSISNDKSDGTGTNIMDGNANYDLGLRSVASFVTAILSMSLLFFLIHRLRQRKIQGRENRQIGEDQRSLGNMGYLERGGLLHGVPMDDIPCGTGYSLWKPPGNYFPRGEAPPPYEEAVAAARAEQALLSMNPHTLLSMNFSDNYISSGNNHSGIAVVANTPNELTVNTQPLSNDSHINAPLMSSSSNRPLSSPGTYANYRPVSQSSTTSTGLNTSTSTTSFTMGTNMYENLPVSIGTTSFNEGSGQHSGGGALSASGHVSAQQQPVLPISHSTIPKSYRQHTTTFPRQSGGAFTISATLSNSDVSSSHRTIPRTLTTQRVVTAGRAKDVSTDCSAKDYLRLSPGNIAPQNLHSVQLSPAAVPANYKDTKDSDVFYADVPVASASALSQPSDCIPTYTAHMTDVSEKTREFKPSLSAANEINASGSFESVACTCSMQALPTLHDDTDDYRSECENCKSATGSRYYLDNEDELVTSLHETMTLHRRPDDAASSATPQYYRTSLTLPTSTRQRTRITGARENWFSTMPESSSGSSDEN